jgi:hypothetical protein
MLDISLYFRSVIQESDLLRMQFRAVRMKDTASLSATAECRRLATEGSGGGGIFTWKLASVSTHVLIDVDDGNYDEEVGGNWEEWSCVIPLPLYQITSSLRAIGGLHTFFMSYLFRGRAGIVQSLQRLATGSTTEGSDFESR